MSTPASRRLRRALAAASLTLLATALAACGFNAQTDQDYQPSVGVNDRSGQVDVLGAVVVSGLEGQGTFVASLANKNESKADTLVSVTPRDSDAGVTTRVAAPIKVDGGQLVNLADAGAVSVTGEPIQAGRFVRLTLTFDSGEELQMNVPVVDQSGYYADIEPADASPSATPSETPPASPTPSP